MKKELIKKINPILETFVDDVLKSFEGLEKIRQEVTQQQTLYQDLIGQKEKELSEIRINKKTEKENLDRKITDLENAKEEYIEKSQSYESLIEESSRSKADTRDDLDKARIELIRAKDIRLQAEKDKADAQKMRGDYQLKLESLKRDTDKIAKDKGDNSDEGIKLAAREKQIFITERKQEETRKELSDLDLDLKVRRKEVDRLVKRYSLEKQLEVK